MKSLGILNRVTVFGLLLAIASTAMAQVKVDTRIGELEFTHDWENGYPTDETVTYSRPKLPADMTVTLPANLIR